MLFLYLECTSLTHDLQKPSHYTALRMLLLLMSPHREACPEPHNPNKHGLCGDSNNQTFSTTLHFTYKLHKDRYFVSNTTVSSSTGKSLAYDSMQQIFVKWTNSTNHFYAKANNYTSQLQSHAVRCWYLECYLMRTLLQKGISWKNYDLTLL